jgi:hypothetical protein
MHVRVECVLHPKLTLLLQWLHRHLMTHALLLSMCDLH